MHVEFKWKRPNPISPKPVRGPNRNDPMHPEPRGNNLRPENGYNRSMQLAILGMRILEVMFFVGLVGSTIVVLISFIEDGKELFGDE